MSKRRTQLEQKTIRFLRKHGVRHYDELIHDQDRARLIENFGTGRKYPVKAGGLVRFRNFGTFEERKINDKRSSPIPRISSVK